MTPQLLTIFSSLIEDACGIHYAPADRDILATKLVGHVDELGHDSLLDYYYRLRYDDPDGQELQRLVDALVVRETYFFRELPPLIALADLVIPEILKRKNRVRIWSAACSTGEEPFTLAILLADRGLLGRVEILGTDISETAIREARSGRRGRRSLREGYPHDLAHQYLDSTARGVSVVPAIRDSVEFATCNLLGDVSGVGLCDVILCRNVLIYFRDDQIARIVGRLHDRLAPCGVLAVGVSESLLRFGTSLVCEERGNAFFYRRAG